MEWAWGRGVIRQKLVLRHQYISPPSFHGPGFTGIIVLGVPFSYNRRIAHPLCMYICCAVAIIPCGVTAVSFSTEFHSMAASYTSTFLPSLRRSFHRVMYTAPLPFLQQYVSKVFVLCFNAPPRVSIPFWVPGTV